MNKFLIGLLTFSIAQIATAEYLVKGATVSEVSNTAGNEELFYISVSGGTGRCADSQIRFPLADAGSEKIYDRAFSIALTAYASGEKINIYDYSESSTDCNGAESIRLIK
jgi:hypothetical protein